MKHDARKFGPPLSTDFPRKTSVKTNVRIVVRPLDRTRKGREGERR